MRNTGVGILQFGSLITFAKEGIISLTTTKNKNKIKKKLKNGQFYCKILTSYGIRQYSIGLSFLHVLVAEVWQVFMNHLFKSIYLAIALRNKDRVCLLSSIIMALYRANIGQIFLLAVMKYCHVLSLGYYSVMKPTTCANINYLALVN